MNIIYKEIDKLIDNDIYRKESEGVPLSERINKYIKKDIIYRLIYCIYKEGTEFRRTYKFPITLIYPDEIRNEKY